MSPRPHRDPFCKSEFSSGEKSLVATLFQAPVAARSCQVWFGNDKTGTRDEMGTVCGLEGRTTPESMLHSVWWRGSSMLFSSLLFVDATFSVGAVAGGDLVEFIVLGEGAVKLLLKDRLGLDRLELGLDVPHVVERVAVGAAAGVGHVVGKVVELVTLATPDGLVSAYRCCTRSMAWQCGGAGSKQ